MKWPSMVEKQHIVVSGFLLGALIAVAIIVLAVLIFPTRRAVAAIMAFSVTSLLAAGGFLIYTQYEQARQTREHLE